MSTTSSLSMTDLYTAAYKNINVILRDLYSDVEEGTSSWLLLKARIVTYPIEPVTYTTYYIPIEVRKTHSHHYTQIVLDQIESRLSTTIVTNTEELFCQTGTTFIQSCISAFVMNADIHPTMTEILAKEYTHVCCVCNKGTIAYNHPEENSWREAITMASSDYTLSTCHECGECYTAYQNKLDLITLDEAANGSDDSSDDDFNCNCGCNGNCSCCQYNNSNSSSTNTCSCGCNSDTKGTDQTGMYYYNCNCGNTNSSSSSTTTSTSCNCNPPAPPQPCCPPPESIIPDGNTCGCGAGIDHAVTIKKTAVSGTLTIGKVRKNIKISTVQLSAVNDCTFTAVQIIRGNDILWSEEISLSKGDTYTADVNVDVTPDNNYDLVMLFSGWTSGICEVSVAFS